ncbi:hypothetical protein SynPROS71_01271 [Synechococcus sp. PROS-7-1]|nr:hypothetical protein SynPROS71_01271 [Synechococcus sp. PROS-7-1]
MRPAVLLVLPSLPYPSLSRRNRTLFSGECFQQLHPKNEMTLDLR